MGACSCAEQRTRTIDFIPGAKNSKEKESQEEDPSLYGSLGKYQINKQTGQWQAAKGGVFLGHLTEGKVLIDKEETFVQQLAEFNARFSVRFSMPDVYFNNIGQILLTIDCFTSRSLHSADIILNGNKLRSKVEVQDEIFGRQPISIILPKQQL